MDNMLITEYNIGFKTKSVANGYTVNMSTQNDYQVTTVVILKHVRT